MKKEMLNAILFFKNEANIEALKKTFLKHNVGFFIETSSFTEVLQHSRARTIDVLVYEYSDYLNPEFLAIFDTSQHNVPNIVLVKSEPSGQAKNVVYLQDAAIYYFALDTLETDLKNNIQTIKDMAFSRKDRKIKGDTVDIRIKDILVKNSITAKHMGYHYLVKAIKLVCSDERKLGNITEDIYKHIANTTGKNIPTIERNIRNAIQMGFGKRVNPDVTCPALENILCEKKGYPTNKQFIGYVAEMIRRM